LGQVATETAAGFLYCLNPKCEHELFATFRDNHQRLYFLAGEGVRVMVRQSQTLVCPKCQQWRRWDDRPKRAAVVGMAVAAS
jgi:uncharacterized protein YbaR (Trm112 family)